MTCSELLRKLAAFEDGVLPQELCAELEAHLQECVTCAELRHDLALLSRLCRKGPRPAMPDGLRLRLVALLRRG